MNHLYFKNADKNLSFVIYYIDKGVIFLAEFCKCGSIIINDHCTNKNCASKVSGKSDSPGRKAAVSSKNKETKSSKPRRASKVISYNLYETENGNNIS